MGRVGRPLVGSGDGWGTGCGARATVGMGSSGWRPEGSLGVWGSESGRTWMLLMAQEHRVLVDTESRCLLVPLLSLSLL